MRDNSNQLLKNFNQDERVLISDHIEQEGNFAKASQKVKDQAEVLRKWHSAIGKELVELGMFTPEQYAKWDKMYLLRVYDPTLQQKIASVRKKAWDALIGKYTMNRGVNLGLPVHAGNKNWNKGDTIVKLQMIDAKGNVHTNFMEKGTLGGATWEPSKVLPATIINPRTDSPNRLPPIQSR